MVTNTELWRGPKKKLDGRPDEILTTDLHISLALARSHRHRATRAADRGRSPENDDKAQQIAPEVVLRHKRISDFEGSVLQTAQSSRTDDDHDRPDIDVSRLLPTVIIKPKFGEFQFIAFFFVGRGGGCGFYHSLPPRVAKSSLCCTSLLL
jgi:hypothetical protein